MALFLYHLHGEYIMGKTVIVGCKLPTGIILESPLDPGIKVELNGANKATIIGAGYGSTEVDDDFWQLWAAQNKDFPAFASHAIFVAKNSAEVVSVAKELKDERTGIEPMQTDGNDPRARGAAVADKD